MTERKYGRYSEGKYEAIINGKLLMVNLVDTSENGDILDYELAFYRETPFSARTSTKMRIGNESSTISNK